MIRVDSFGARTRDSCDLNSSSEIFVVLFNVCFELPVQTIAVNWEAPSSVWIGTTWDWAAVCEIGLGRDAVMSAVAAVFSDERRYVMLFLQ